MDNTVVAVVLLVFNLTADPYRVYFPPNDMWACQRAIRRVKFDMRVFGQEYAVVGCKEHRTAPLWSYRPVARPDQ
jgi:hypothetical protein